jgi:hypothetical protein
MLPLQSSLLLSQGFPKTLFRSPFDLYDRFLLVLIPLMDEMKPSFRICDL